MGGATVRTLVFGFDGVLMERTSGTGPPSGKPVRGMLDLVRRLHAQGWQIEVCTSRALTHEGRNEVVHWLVCNSFIEFIECVTSSLHVATAYIVDPQRTVAFTGSAEDLLETVENFQNGWKEKEKEE